MGHYKEYLLKLKNATKEENIQLNVEMKKHTSFRVGGPVDVLVTPESYEEVINIIKVCKGENIPYYIIGNGSNLLIKDGGLRGIAIKLSKLNKVTVDGAKIIAQSGASIGSVSIVAREAKLSGLEFACGIPGSVGGAIAMNAGAYDGEMSYITESALIIDENGELKTLSKEQLKLGYRTSAIIVNKYIVLEVTFSLRNWEYENIKKKMDELMQRRREKQPLEYPSAGSTFKRPVGYFAGKLIEDSGLKGTNVGGAEVSDKHSGFIINKGNATAKDILDLIELVQNTVMKKYNVELHPEIRIIGEDGNTEQN